MTATVILPPKQLKLPVLNETHTHSNILRPRLNQLKLQLFNKIQKYDTIHFLNTLQECPALAIVFFLLTLANT